MPQLTMTAAEFREMMAKGGASKYRNRKVTVDGIKFDSEHEAAEWFKLVALQSAGLIRDLRRQVRYHLGVGGVHICVYVADFVYEEPKGDGWAVVVADAKGFLTQVYKLKKKLMAGCHGIEVREC